MTAEGKTVNGARQPGKAEADAGAPAVLDGIRIIDFSRVFAGPAAAQILGDLGADVIKVENPDGGDEARDLGITRDAKPKLGVSPSFLALNRNKRSIVLDLRSEAGREVASRLVASADVIIHNFRPGTMDRWGLGFEAVHQAHPRLIYGEFFAYGREGPMSDFGANDLALQAHSGLMSLTGEPGRPPVRVGTAAIDLHGAMALVGAILAALYSREKTGLGQRVESSLLLSSAHLLNYFYSEYWIDAVIRAPMGTANHLSVPNQVFPTADGSVVIIAPADAMWRRCARALSPEKLDKPEYRTIKDRQLRRAEVVEAISAVTRTMTSQEVVDRLGPVKVNVARVNTIAQAAEDPQLAISGGVTEFVYADSMVRAVATPFRLAATPTGVRHPPPTLDQHRGEILANMGYSEGEIFDLDRRGAFGRAP